MRRFAPILILLLLVTRLKASDTQNHVLITVDNAHQLTEIAESQASAASVTQVAFNPVDETLAFIQSDQSLGYGSTTFLNAALEPMRLEKNLSKALAIAFSPDGSLFAEVSEAGEIQVYITQTLELNSSIQIEKEEPILNLAIDRNNRYLAVAIGAPEIVTTAESVFQLFDIESGKELIALKRETTDIDEIFGTGTVFDDKGEYVFLSTSDGMVHRWDLATQTEEIVGEDALRGTRILASSANYQVIYLTQDGGIRLIDWDGNKRDIANGQHKEARFFLPSAIAIHPTQPLIAISYITPSSRTDKPATRDSILQLWNLDSGELLYEMPVSEPGTNRLVDLAFSPDGTLLVSGGTDGTVRLWGVPEK
jgi:WD40 repeat protein